MSIRRLSSYIRLFGPAVCIGALAAGGATLQAQERKIMTPYQHAPNKIHQSREDGTAESTNWSGYAVTGPNGSVTSVSGSWVIPASTCASNSSPEYASFWVGIDGWSSSTVEQIGTDSDCSRGTPSYYAWYEFYPEPSYYAGRLTNLKPFDVISATVTYNKNTNEFTATIEDLTQKLSFTTTFKAKHSPDRSSAEWIAVAPSGSKGILPLADFTAVNMGLQYTSVASTNNATVGTASGPIGSFGSNVWTSTMVSESNPSVVKAKPSALTDNGSSFYVTWMDVGP